MRIPWQALTHDQRMLVAEQDLEMLQEEMEPEDMLVLEKALERGQPRIIHMWRRGVLTWSEVLEEVANPLR